jgi:cytochrome c2
LVAGAALCVFAGCSSNSDKGPGVLGGNMQQGRVLLQSYGCGSCHSIPGVRAAVATVGPPLSGIAKRTFLAGRLPNTPENMENWIRFPKKVDPQTAMPEVGVTERDARDMVAYLYTLR